MVSLQAIRASDAKLASTLPAGLVAIFVGATSGVGETSLKQFAKYAKQPRIYFIGRSASAAERIKKELEELNAEGTYDFIRSDVSLLKNVDEVCREIKSKETVINLLFLSSGTLALGKKTEEGLDLITATAYYARTRFVVNLLPLLQKASSLRRVVTIFAGTKEGPILHLDDLESSDIPLTSARGHLCSLQTLTLEAIAKTAPEVSFLHVHPGFVKGNLTRDNKGILWAIGRLLFKFLGIFFSLPLNEAGERETFMATSARFAPAVGGGEGVPLNVGVGVSLGTDGKAGSGVYSVDWDGEPAGERVQQLLAGYRKDEVGEKVWSHMEEVFERITGSKHIE